MNLPFFKKKNDDLRQPRDYFFALEISHDLVKSAVWSVINGKAHVLSVGSVAHWDSHTDASLITACDQSLSDATTRLDSSGAIQPEKVIFGLPVDWLENEKITSSHLQTLRKLTTELSLTAVGFVITPDAAVRYLQHNEGVPPTAILLGVYQQHLEVTLVRLGKTDGVQQVQRSNKVVADLVEGLTRFPHVDMLPSRILLYNSGLDLEDIRQQLLAHPWQAPQTKMPFLHFPKIEILPSDFTIRAIALAGGEEVAKAAGLITATTSAPIQPEPVATPEVTDISDLGFAQDVDVAQSGLPASAPPAHPRFESAVPEMTEEQYEHISTPPSRKLPKLKLPSLSLPQFSIPKLSFGKSPVMVIIIALLALVGLGAAYWFLPKATVTLTVVPKDLNHSFELVADPSATSVAATTIPAKIVENTTSSDKSAPVTGTKLIGDKATGSVKIINGTSVPRKFSSGTVISSGNLKFTFDSAVDVASASGTADPNSYKPGEATVKVTASQIGSDSNLSAGTQFKIGSYSSLDYVAKNEAAFAGGTSRQATAVSKEDITKLRAEMQSGLKDQAKSELSNVVPEGYQLVPETVTTTTTSEEFSAKEGEEADNLTGRTSVKAKGLAFAKTDLDSVVSSQISSLVTNGYAIDGTPSTTFTVKKTDASKVTLVAAVTAHLMPILSNDTVIAKIIGLSPKGASEYLSTLPGVSHISFTFRPQLPSFLLTLPHQAKNIGLITQSSQAQ